MSKNWYPVIDYSLCKECGACINLCKQGVYEKEIHRPKVIYPDGCIQGCHGCGNLCPANAIDYVGDASGLQRIGCSCS